MVNRSRFRRLSLPPGESLARYLPTSHARTGRWQVGDCHSGMRLDAFLATRLPSRHAAQKLIRAGMASIDDIAERKPGRRLHAGEIVVVTIPEAKQSGVLPQDIPLDVLFEDDDMIVVNKAKGMVVHPAPGNAEGTLVNALLHHCRSSLSGIGGVQRPGIVHRLDKDTSGALVAAKNDSAHISLAAQIKAHTMRRIYVALVHGVPPERGVVDAPLGRHKVDRQKMAVTVGGRNAVTHFRRLERLGDFSLLELCLETGRTHQIRVHLSHIGYPVVGDAVYGPRRSALGLTSQALHAWRLSFVHPRWRKPMDLVASLPDSLATALQTLRAAQD